MFSLAKKILYYVSPSFRIGFDPIPIDSKKRYSPIPVTRLRVNYFIKRKILELRPNINLDFRFEKNKRLTVVIPYRDREDHLSELLPVLKQFLDEQLSDYKILVVEQALGKPFNRGKIKNIGARHLWDESDYFCFHDVDLLPLTANYSYPTCPLRLIKRFEETWRRSDALGGTNFGGVVTLNKGDFFSVNGYSNDFWGWGKEDDDLFARMVLKGLVPYEDNGGLFRELPNPVGQEPQKKDIRLNRTKRSRFLRGLKMMEEDGLSNVTYKVLADRDMGDYQRIKVDI